MATDFTNHPNPLERRAAAIIEQINQQHTLNNPTAEKRATIRALINDLRSTLDYDPEDEETTLLEHQAKALDHAFRRLMGDADTTFENSDQSECDPMKYAAAFKAQDQYRRTITTLKALKQKKKGYGKRKRKSR